MNTNKVKNILSKRGYTVSSDTVVSGIVASKGGRKFHISGYGTYPLITSDRWCDKERLDLFNPVKGGWRSLK